MSWLFETGTNNLIGPGTIAGPGETLFIGNLTWSDDGLELLMVWDTSNVRSFNTAENLAYAKTEKIEKLLQEAVRLAGLIYPHIRHPSEYTVLEDLYQHINSDSRVQPPVGDLLLFKTVADKYKTKKAEINALPTITQVETYNITAGW